MSLSPLKPTHKPVRDYFTALAQFHKYGHTTEGNTRSAFADILKKCCSPYGWHLVEEYAFKGTNKQHLRADGALVDDLTLVHGLWEAKDTADDLAKEIRSKVNKGYPLTNILFQSPGHAILYQDSRIAFDRPIETAEALIEVLELFFEYRQAHEVDWEDAVTKFAEKIPDLARGVTTILEEESASNGNFREAFTSFAELCRQSINPDLTDDSIRKMLVQHLLTERIFRKVFNNQEFLQRNVIAVEIEKVIRSITARHFSRDEFLRPLDRFYTSIERAAESQKGYTEKQQFLNAVYEKFFQRFDTRQADTHGIVYTPQPIVDFMVRFVEEILENEFKKSLSDSDVHILDPFTGTGNFITRIMREIKRSALPGKYANELHCNEIMLLPYYIASMNIENVYMERVGSYSSFSGLCLTDSFELTEARQALLSFMSKVNNERIVKQKAKSIFVVLGNPPYNAGQEVGNDNNPNREYPLLHERIWDTYATDSEASLLSTLDDPYIQAFRWASDRLRNTNGEVEDGVVCFVTNNRFLNGKATDGMRRSLALEFDRIYLVDLGGDVRSDGKISGTTHNVFGIQAGVAITMLIRTRKLGRKATHAEIFAVQAESELKKVQKFGLLAELTLESPSWVQLATDTVGQWRLNPPKYDWSALLPMGTKADKKKLGDEATSIFHIFSAGVKSNRDRWTFNFSKITLVKNIQTSVDFYNQQLNRLPESDVTLKALRTIVEYEDTQLSWSDDLRKSLLRRKPAKLQVGHVRPTYFRPFSNQYLYYDRLLDDRVCLMPSHFGPPGEIRQNIAIGSLNHSQAVFACFAVDLIPSHDFGGRPTQFLPFYTYDKEGARRENITAWALLQFRTHYADDTITKWDIFHATYAVLHHPEYRTRYAANLKRGLPRIPFPPDFHIFAASGKRLVELHIDYKQQPEYRLEQIEDPKAEVTFRVERMRLNRENKSELRYNSFLTLRGIPLDAYSYRLGNRSALEWVIDQYRVTTDARSGIVNDPNREDDPHYILRLIGQVITVSLETNKIVGSLPSLNLGTS